MTKYDKERLRKWTNSLAWEIIGRGDNINPFIKAANAMIKDSENVAKDIGGATPHQIVRFLEGEYLR